MTRLFGTDGVRGLANRELTAQLALQLGDAAVHVFGEDERAAQAQSAQTQALQSQQPQAQQSQAQHSQSARERRNTHVAGVRRRAIVGRDTRVSGDFLSAALASGMSAGGFDVIDVGVLPTPGIAYLTSVLNVQLGAVISASHNAMPDNGIKFFARGGFKLPDAKEDEIEALLGQEWSRPTGGGVGRISHDTITPTNLYLDHLLSSVIAANGEFGADKPLAGLTVVADCANGANSAVAPEALRRAGAEVVVINASPDGYNINNHAGSTHPEQLQAMVKASGADLGVAFDGDADRCLAVDERGVLVNGDQIMGILAVSMQRNGTLAHNTVVLTVMSNLGLLLALEDLGINTVKTGVGDRYVLEAMLDGGYTLGGEQSGHVINREFATTGDGTLTALLLCKEVARSGKTLSQLAAAFPQLPQQLVNVSGVDKAGVATNATVQQAIAAEERYLGKTGRVLLRASGTEPLVRVMAEADTQEKADEVCERLAHIVYDELAL